MIGFTIIRAAAANDRSIFIKMARSNSKDGSQEDNALKELLYNELRDLYHAENQLVKALPKMAKASNNPELKKAFEEHLEQTEGHVSRLEEAFDLLGEKARAKVCPVMMGLVQEGKETITEGKKMDDNLADLALIAAAQKVEHYEISGYGTLRTMAEKLGEDQVASLLSQTESEEKQADELLTNIAKPMLDNITGGMEMAGQQM